MKVDNYFLIGQSSFNITATLDLIETLKKTRNSYFCVTPKIIDQCLSHENIKKQCHKKVTVCFYNLGEENF